MSELKDPATLYQKLYKLLKPYVVKPQAGTEIHTAQVWVTYLPWFGKLFPVDILLTLSLTAHNKNLNGLILDHSIEKVKQGKPTFEKKRT